MPNIKALDGSEPHEDWKGWRNFLKTCEVRDTYQNVTFYGATNCNYIVFPDGTLIQNFGYHGKALMTRIRQEGADKVLEQLRKNYAEIRNLIDKTQKSA